MITHCLCDPCELVSNIFAISNGIRSIGERKKECIYYMYTRIPTARNAMTLAAIFNLPFLLGIQRILWLADVAVVVHHRN